jgi:transposase
MKLSHKHFQVIDPLRFMRIGVHQVYGSHRRPVGAARSLLPAEAAGRWARTAVARCAPSAQRCVVDSAHRSCLVGPARPLSSLSNLPSPVSTVATQRPTRAHSETGGRRFTRPRQTGPVRSVHRRQLQQGQKRGSAVRYDRRGKGCYIMAIADRHGLPIAVHVAGAGAHESGLVEATLQQRFLSTPPERLIGDKAYDSAPLARRLRSRYRTQLIAPHRDNRCRKATQDGRSLRRVRRRWRVERLFAWLQHFRRVVTRWERKAENYLAMIHLGCLRILLRYL